MKRTNLFRRDHNDGAFTIFFIGGSPRNNVIWQILADHVVQEQCSLGVLVAIRLGAPPGLDADPRPKIRRTSSSTRRTRRSRSNAVATSDRSRFHDSPDVFTGLEREKMPFAQQRGGGDRRSRHANERSRTRAEFSEKHPQAV
jgi:hypothetical protein